MTAHAKGALGSVWQSDLRMYNPTSEKISGKLIFTERGTSSSPSDLSLAYTIAPGEVTVLEDVYELSHPGQDGVALCLVKPDGGRVDPVLDPTTYNLLPDGGEVSTRPTVFRPESEYFGPGSVLAGITGKETERTGAYVMSGPSGADITFTGPGGLTAKQSYKPDTFVQYVRAEQLFEKATLEPNALLRATITAGSARLALTRTNNVTNQALWEDFAAATGRAEQVIPMTAHARGVLGSVWRSDLRMHNPASEEISGKLIFTERGMSRSPSDLSLAYTIAPGEVTVLEDLYSLAHPGQDGVALCLVKPDGGKVGPVLDPTTYNLLPDGGEMSTRPTVFSPDSEYFGPGFVLAGIVGKQTERTGAYVMSGPSGAEITFTGPGGLTAKQTYEPDTFVQYVRAEQLFEKAALEPNTVLQATKATLEPNTLLRATITAGSARLALTRTNNVTNQALWEDLEVIQGPPNPEAAASYVDKWLPEHTIWLNNREIRTLINGADGIPDHAEELATDLNVGRPNTPYDTNVIRGYADGRGYPPREVDSTKDPFLWDNANTTNKFGSRLGKVIFFAVSEPHPYTCGDPWLTTIRTLIRQSLIEQVTSWPEKYGGSRPSGKPNVDHDPTWDTQDPN
jgi:hypothetical protein